MTVSRTSQAGVVEEWLSVHEACALIGVAPATLRRWSAAGDVPAFTTPGGHRRFARSTILGLLPSAGGAVPNLGSLGQATEHMTRVYRRHLSQACGGMSWLDGMGEDELAPLREHGRVIAGSLLGYIDGATPQARATAIEAAVSAASEYGRIAARGSAGIGETVEAFLRFRMLFLGELGEMVRRRGLDTLQTTEMLGTATQAIDQLLVALMGGHAAEMAQSTLTRGEA